MLIGSPCLKQNNVVYPSPCFLLGATIDKTLFDVIYTYSDYHAICLFPIIFISETKQQGILCRRRPSLVWKSEEIKKLVLVQELINHDILVFALYLHGWELLHLIGTGD
jgi:hypothetical protein